MNRTISVKRSILPHIQHLEYLSGTEFKPVDLAEQRIRVCQTAGNTEGTKLWRSVWLHLMLKEYAPGTIQIIEDEIIN